MELEVLATRSVGTAFVDVVREVEARRLAEGADGSRARESRGVGGALAAARRLLPAGAAGSSSGAYGEKVGSEWKKRRTWFPPMHAYGTPFLAAIFRRHGIDAAPLPVEDREAFEIGRRLTRGTECLPTAVTIGALVKKLREIGADPKREAFFMPAAEGPCRFGQYATLHKLILQDLGWGDIEIVSPSSYNAYQGIPEAVRRDMWTAIVASDIMFKAVCKARPYEREPGSVDRAALIHQSLIERAMESGRRWEPELARAVEALAALRGDGPPKPLVGVVGEIYVRCNGYSNGEVIRAIEAAGGEGWLVLSDIAEHLGLRTRAELLAAIAAAGLQVMEKIDVKPHHPRVSDTSDPLHAARAAELTSLWRLTAKPTN